jgi:methylglyoxal synthase
VKALLRIAMVWNIPVACDRATAETVISGPLMTGAYERQLPHYTAHFHVFRKSKACPSNGNIPAGGQVD